MNMEKLRWWIAISVASEFMSFIGWLNDCSIPYFIAWGYEKLPEERSGGDVDIYVHPKFYKKVTEELSQRGYSSAKCPMHHSHEHFTRSGSHTLDVFSSFCFSYSGKIVVLSVDPSLLLQDRVRWKEFWVPSTIVELLFTVLRMLGGRKDMNCMKRFKKCLVGVN